MSDRFYTTVKVSGPNADAAAKSAHAAFSSQPKDEYGYDPYRGGWCDSGNFSPCYFDHDSGQGAVLIVTEVSRQFPTEIFEIYVSGSCGEGVQGTVYIMNGVVIDGRSDYISFGEEGEGPWTVMVKGSEEQIRQAVEKDAIAAAEYAAAEAALKQRNMEKYGRADIEDLTMEAVLGPGTHHK